MPRFLHLLCQEQVDDAYEPTSEASSLESSVHICDRERSKGYYFAIPHMDACLASRSFEITPLGRKNEEPWRLNYESLALFRCGFMT